MTKENDETVESVHNPINLGQNGILELLNLNEKKINKVTFINPANLSCSADEYNLPSVNTLLIPYKTRTFKITIKRKKNVFTVIVSLVANFIIDKVKECNCITNNILTTPEVNKFYLIDIINKDGKAERDIEIKGEAKTDYRKFQNALNEKSNGNMIIEDKNVFKAFIDQFITPKIACQVDIYQNAGILREGEFLYENAYAKNSEILRADKDGYIQIAENKYLKLDSSKHCTPKLAKSLRTGTEIAKELVENILECWNDNYILALITIGYMIMSIHFKEFIKYGVPTGILFGESGAGKTTKVRIGLAILGMPKEALLSGGSTIRSNEHFYSKYNGICICIDDVKGSTLASQNFIEQIKTLYHGTIRARMKNFGKDVDFIYISSPLIYSTNDKVPVLKEVSNRIIVIEMFGKKFDASKFKYHESNKDKLDELSLILPEILKISSQDVFNIYNNAVKLLESSIKDTQRRVINNLAYAYAGIVLLLSVAKVELSDLQKKFVEYAQAQADKYEDIKDIIDKVLAEIPILTSLGQIHKDITFRFDSIEYPDRIENIICFHKETLITKINQCNFNDKSKYIDTDLFDSYSKTHPRFRGYKSVRYKEDFVSTGLTNNRRSICFCVDGLDDYAMFFGTEAPESIPVNVY